MFNNLMYGDEEWTPTTVRGINVGSPDEEFDNTPEARIAFAERAFKNSSSRSDRRAAFNDAFRAARMAGMQDFMFNGTKYAVKLAQVAGEQNKVIQKQQAVIDKSQAHQTGMTKAQFDMKQAAAHVMSQYHPAVPLNTLPVPEDVREREAIGGAYQGMTDLYGASLMLGGAIEGATGMASATANRAAQLSRLAEGNPNFMTNRSLDLLMGGGQLPKGVRLANAAKQFAGSGRLF